jgi:hypothetical protein
MTTHLTIVSKTKADDDGFLDHVDNELENKRPHRRARCQKGFQLRSRVLNSGLEVIRLDLVGHAQRKETQPGVEVTQFLLGEDVVLQSDQEPPAVLKQLNSVLPDNAVVRILGCETGAAASGLRLLRAVSEALNGREVFGMTAALLVQDFGPQGLKASAEQWLISSRTNQVLPAWDRYSLEPQDKPAALIWEARIPGFKAAGRAQPSVLLATTLLHQGVRVSFSSDLKTALVADKPEIAPLVLRWNQPDAAPPLAELVKSLR